MNTNRKIAVAVGVLFLLGYVGVFLGGAVYSPFVDAPDYLNTVYPNRTQVILGMLIELVNDAAVIGIPVMLFPILKKHGERLALAYLSFRIIESVILIVSKFNVLSLIDLSREYIAAGASSAAYLEVVGASALAARYWAGKIQVVFFVIGALTFYYILYRSKLLPRFIAIWGFIAVASLVAANVLPVPDLTQAFSPAQLLFLPIFLSEILVAVWLIVKGFNPSVIARGTAVTATSELLSAA